MPVSNFDVTASADDGDWYASTFANNGLTLRAGKQSTSASAVYVRFLNILASGDINSAKLSIKSGATQSNTVPMRIYGVKNADPTAPTTASDANGRTLTTAYVDWSPGSWTNSVYYDSPDISNIIQELVDSYDYTGSEAMMFYIKDNGAATSTNRQIRSYDHGATTSQPKLQIDYTTVNAPPTISPITIDNEEFLIRTISIKATGEDEEEDELSYRFQIADNTLFLDGENIESQITSGSGTTIHPNPQPTGLDGEGKIPVDDIPGMAWLSTGGKLKSMQFYFGLHETNPEDVDGQYLVRVYEAEGLPINPVPAVWTAATGYLVGDIVRPNSLSNGNLHFVYRCIDPGTSGGSEPSWPGNGVDFTTITDGQNVTDNTVIWEAKAGLHPKDPVAVGEMPTPGWLAQSDIYPYDESYGDTSWKTLEFDEDNQIQLTPGAWYIALLLWWPNDRVYENAITVRTAALSAATHVGNCYIDSTEVANHGPRITDDTWFKVTVENILIDVSSDTDDGFVDEDSPFDTDPFEAGDMIAYTTEEDLLERFVTYVWRALVVDPGGSNVDSSWTTPRYFSIIENPEPLLEPVIDSDSVMVFEVGSVPVDLNQIVDSDVVFDFVVGVDSYVIELIVDHDSVFDFVVGTDEIPLDPVVDSDSVFPFVVGPGTIIIDPIIDTDVVMDFIVGIEFVILEQIIDSDVVFPFQLGQEAIEIDQIVDSDSIFEFSVGGGALSIDQIIDSDIILPFVVGEASLTINQVIDGEVIFGFSVVNTRYVYLLYVIANEHPVLEVLIE